MSLLNFFGRFYSKVFISINFLAEKIEVQTLVIKDEQTLSKENKKFATTSLADEELQEYIKKAALISPFHYISTLDRANEQGIVPTCSLVEAKNYIDTSISKLLCVHQDYSLFTSKTDFDKQRKEFETVGLDYLFSPVNIIENIFSDKIENSSGAYIFIQESALMLLIINSGKVAFSDYIPNVDSSKGSEESLDDDVSLDGDDDLDFDLDLDDDDDFGIDLEDMEANDLDDDLGGLDDLDDLDDIEDLDDLDDDSSSDIEEFDESGTEDEFHPEDEEDEEKSSSSANLDYERFQTINKMVKKYYSDVKYDNDFIETIFVANGGGVGHELKGYLEDELFVSVIIRHIHPLDELNRLAQREVLNES